MGLDIKLARDPALVALYANLARLHCYFYDVLRSSEPEILRLWADLFGIKFLAHFSKGNIARGARGVPHLIV
ncbi:hypothetical protein [Mesorhizobium sp.]|nr:hypothetical protein [Mesorhizobium sp.]